MTEKGAGGSSLGILVRHGEWTRLGVNPEFKKLSPEAQILTAREAVVSRRYRMSRVFADLAGEAGAQIILSKILELGFIVNIMDSVLVIISDQQKDFDTKVEELNGIRNWLSAHRSA